MPGDYRTKNKYKTKMGSDAKRTVNSMYGREEARKGGRMNPGLKAYLAPPDWFGRIVLYIAQPFFTIVERASRVPFARIGGIVCNINMLSVREWGAVGRPHGG